MGKAASPFDYQEKKPHPALPPVLIAAVLVGVVLMAVMGWLLWKSFGKTTAPLPENPAQNLPPLPSGPPLPEVKQELPPPGEPLTKTEAELPPSKPVTEAAPAPVEPQPSGQITWSWALYSVSPQVLGVPLSPSPGFQFCALGVTIKNDSTVAVAVDHNHFFVTVDGRSYGAELISSAITFNQLPFLAPTTLQPGATMGGCVGYMIPATYAHVSADWRPPGVPSTVKIVRIDPQPARQ